MALLSGRLAAQTPWGLGPPQIVPIENWVSLIESNGYANGYGLNWTPDAEAVALISRAEYLFITDPSLIGIPNSTFQQQLANNLVDNFGWFNNYWICHCPREYDRPVVDVTSRATRQSLPSLRWGSPKLPKLSASSHGLGRDR